MSLSERLELLAEAEGGAKGAEECGENIGGPCDILPPEAPGLGPRNKSRDLDNGEAGGRGCLVTGLSSGLAIEVGGT